MNTKTDNGPGTSPAGAALIGRAYATYHARAAGRGDELISWPDSKKNDYQAYTSA